MSEWTAYAAMAVSVAPALTYTGTSFVAEAD